jgi:3-oxoacyl-[acyl-carrier protein] reductase
MGRIIAYSMANADRMVGMPAMAAHFTAKVGVLSLVRTLARALARHGITVNAVSPGYIDSGGAPPEELEAAIPRIPAGRLGAVDDAVYATSFLISDEAAYVNGTSLVVSGGLGRLDRSQEPCGIRRTTAFAGSGNSTVTGDEAVPPSRSRRKLG